MTASSLTPLTRTTLSEHRAELRRQAQRDLENAEQKRMRDEKQLQLQKGDLRRKERELDERDEQLRADRAALDRSRAETMLADLGDDVRRAPVVSGQTMALADAIVAAGAARRNEIGPPPLPQNDQAKAIILSGRARRSEALTAAERGWLDNYCRKQDVRR